MSTSNLKNRQVFSFGKESFSAFQPIDIKPVIGRNWVTNGVNNINFKTYQDAYDDSPTNASIINAYVSYIYGEGLVDQNGKDLTKYISKEDALLAVQDLKKFGGFSLQVIWNSSDSDKKPLKLEYLPIFKLGVNYDQTTTKVDGYWYSYDWTNKTRFKPKLYPLFTGSYKQNDLEVIYVRRPTHEPFFPIPDYLSGIPWARIEGEIANAGFSHFKNSLSEITLINYNSGECETEEIAKKEADRIRESVTGSTNNGHVIVSFNDGVENAVTVDRVAPAELSQHNVFYSEEAERKLIVAHSAPPILFAGSNQGTGFSNNADEREIALKDLYRRNINPFREIFLDGVKGVFSLIDQEIKLDFKDFEEETELDNNDGSVNSVDEVTLQSQAQLKGSVGGVSSLLDVQASYLSGATSYESAIAILDLIYGFNRLQAVRLLGEPKKSEDGTNTVT
jgi:hypothetical protein